jgi:hypothetical protein
MIWMQVSTLRWLQIFIVPVHQQLIPCEAAKNLVLASRLLNDPVNGRLCLRTLGNRKLR